jgi:multiple sugar transport system substrate-binding protein
MTHHVALALGCAALMIPPLSADAADLVVWWEQGFYPQEDEAVAEIIAAFEQETGKNVELVQPAYEEVPNRIQAALQSEQPPGFFFSTASERWVAEWAYEDRLVDLEGALGTLLSLFDTDAVEGSTFLNGNTGHRGLYALPMGRRSNHIIVWKSFLERAGFTLADIPAQWEAFWSFWCDRVQPAVRQAMGRDDIWGVGLPMSTAALDTDGELFQFQLAYEAPWFDADRQLQVDDPEIRAGMINALEAYTLIWRKGCTPPDSITWSNIDNNKRFLAQTVVMTANESLSIPGTLRRERSEDYYKNSAMIDWPLGAHGQPLVLRGGIVRAVVFKGGGNAALADEFVRFLAEGGWLSHWLTFAGDRFLPPIRELTEQPFWLDTTDPHRMRGAIQILNQPHHIGLEVRDMEWRSGPIWEENVWGKAVHRVVTDGITPEQAVDEAIARIKQILSE